MPHVRVTLALLALTSVHGVAGCRRVEAPAAANHAELASLFTADQADRRQLPAPGTPGARDVIARDSARRERVKALMGTGAARTSADFYHAAIVSQHGRDSSDFLRAHEWSRRAFALDSTNDHAGYIVAASWDRYMRSRGEPQWYGTQLIGRPGEPVRLYAIDTTKVTDADRRKLRVPTLDSLRRRERALSAPPRQAPRR